MKINIELVFQYSNYLQYILAECIYVIIWMVLILQWISNTV